MECVQMQLCCKTYKWTSNILTVFWLIINICVFIFIFDITMFYCYWFCVSFLEKNHAVLSRVKIQEKIQIILFPNSLQPETSIFFWLKNSDFSTNKNFSLKFQINWSQYIYFFPLCFERWYFFLICTQIYVKSGLKYWKWSCLYWKVRCSYKHTVVAKSPRLPHLPRKTP